MSQLIQHQGFAPANITEAIKFSEMLSKSQMVPKQYQGKPEDILVAVQWGYEVGLAPMQALQNIAVINGKPSVYGDAAMALVLASPVCENIEETIEGEGTENPVAVCTAKRRGRSPVVAKFSVSDAKRAGLWGKQGPWTAYPKRMLAMRARGFALRDAFADVLKGLITAEEAQDYPNDRPIAKVTPISKNPLAAIAPPEPPPAPDDDRQQQDTLEEEQRTAEELKAEFQAAGMEVIEVETVVEIQQPDETVAEIQQGTYGLYIPGKETEWFTTKADWAKAYSALGEKVALAGKASPEARIKKLQELRAANEVTMQRLDPLELTIHSRAMNTRLQELQEKAKVAQQNPPQE
jgi:hypothetical protein